MKEFSENNVKERLSALLGLAATKNDSIETCPSPQQLALFIDGQLKKKKYSQMLAHLNQCEECRSIWLETASYLESKPDYKEASIGQKIIQGIGDFLTPKPLIIGGITATLLIMLAVMPGSHINQQIESGYETLASQSNMEAISVAKAFAMPWENSVKAFSKANAEPEKNAFGSGLWQGKNKLTSSSQPLPPRLIPPEKGDWKETGFNSHYQFGRLVMLLWVEAQLTANPPDWAKYQKIALQLHENLAEYAENKEIAQSMLLSLEQIEEKVKALKADSQQNIIEKKPLQRLLEIIMQKFSPG